MRATPRYLSYVIMGSSNTLVTLLTVCYGIICESFVSLPTQQPPCWTTSCWKLTKLPASSGGRSSDQAALRSNTDQEREIFDWLAKNAGVKKSVSLGVTSGGFRGLLADCDIQQGQIMLEVPSGVCLWSNRDGVVSGLYGQTDLCWEAAGDLRNPVSDEDFARGMTWDVRLALGLMEATSDPQIGGKLWPIYGRLLPQPHTVTLPFCLPERLLTQLHNEGMAGRARKQVERLRSLYPSLMQQTLLSHPRTAVYAGVKTGSPGSKDEGSGVEGGAVGAESDVAPMALAWAFAMVRSRAFAGGDDRFAFVPFLDMANHGFAPSSNFTFEDPGVFRLRAMRDVRAGEEVTISYGENLDAEQLMVQYGLPLNPTVSLSRPLADPVSRRNRSSTASSPLGEEARCNVMDEMFMRGQQRFAREAGGDKQRFEGLVRRAIPLIPNIITMMEESCGAAGALGARVCLQELQAYRSANFPTSEQQDQELLKFCESEGKGKVDQRLAEVVRYRIDRKEAHSMAVGILEEFLSAQEASGGST